MAVIMMRSIVVPGTTVFFVELKVERRLRGPFSKPLPVRTVCAKSYYLADYIIVGSHSAKTYTNYLMNLVTKTKLLQSLILMWVTGNNPSVGVYNCIFFV